MFFRGSEVADKVDSGAIGSGTGSELTIDPQASSWATGIFPNPPSVCARAVFSLKEKDPVLRTLQRFATVVFIGAAFAALISACSSTDATPPPGGAGATAAGGAPGGAGAATTAGAPGTAGAGTAGAGTAGAPAASGDPVNGKLVYNGTQTVCNSCHGDHGEGNLGPNITGSTPAGIGDWTLAQFTDATRNGKNRQGGNLFSLMPKFDASAASDKDIADLFAYLKTQMNATVVPGSYCSNGGCTGGK